MKNIDVVVSGVGGQGVIIAAVILAEAAIGEGLDAFVSEIHGMAQRGGAVVSHVRIGRGIHTPPIPEGSADAILGLEPAEVLRALRFTNQETKIVINSHPLIPTTVSLGISRYPSFREIIRECRRFSRFIIEVDAARLASEAGSHLAQNTVLLGALAATGVLPLKNGTLQRCIRRLVPKRYVEVNLNAFKKGLRSV